MEVVHDFESAKPQGLDPNAVSRNEWNALHNVTMPTARLIGNSEITPATAQDIRFGTGFSTAGGSLSADIDAGTILVDGMTIDDYIAQRTTEHIYPPFVAGAYDDRFLDGVYSGWTQILPTSPTITVTERVNWLGITHPGGDAAVELHAFLKQPSPAPTANAIIETCFQFAVRSGVAYLFGLLYADGTTIGSGAQVGWFFNPQSTFMSRLRFTGFNAGSGSETTYTWQARANHNLLFMRLQYLGSNNWRAYMSVDGVNWQDWTGSYSMTLTPTHVGFFVSSSSLAAPGSIAVRYFRYIP